MENSKYLAFVTAAKHGSFTQAAKELNYSTSGISQLIGALEKEHGFALFTRTKKGVALTKNGATILPIIQEILRQEEHLTQMVSFVNGLEVGEVTIAAYSSVATHWLPEVIKEYRQLYPQIKLNLREGIRQEVAKWLETKQADIAFLSYQENMPYQWFPLAQDKMIAVLPQNHPLATAKSYPLARCSNEKFIMPALGKDDDVIDMFEKYQLNPDIVFSTLENFVALTMIEQGLGMSIMNELITKRWECDVVKLPVEPPVSITLGIAVESYQNSSPAVKKFIDIAIGKLQRLSDKKN